MSSRILVVDDDVALAEMIGIVLEGEGYTVSTCPDGAKAVAAFQEHHPDLVLLDVMLPGMDGFEVCAALRAESNVPIVMLTARSDTADVVTGLEAGADDYVPKPFKPRELVARVRAHLSRYERLVAAKQGDVLVIRGLKIDRTARRVFVNGEERTLTAKEFDLLNFLASNPNRVFTREALFREIWGEESLGEIATITVHVKKIREKIELDTAKPQYIETIWGVGYRFRV